MKWFKLIATMWLSLVTIWVIVGVSILWFVERTLRKAEEGIVDSWNADFDIYEDWFDDED